MTAKKSGAKPRASDSPLSAAVLIESSFAEVVGFIEQARQRAYQAVNTELVGLYWRIGEYISAKLAAAEWGEGVVDRLAQHLARTVPGQRGFTRRNLFRMRQFFEAYSTAGEKVTALLTQLPWTHNLIILTQSKRPEEREFYLRIAVQEKWTSRELERQVSLGTFERAVLSPAKVSAALTQMHGPAATGAFKDSYSVEFLNLPAHHSEAELHTGLLGQLRTFLIELGRDFCFVGSEFPLQVGGRDFALDLLFFHRGLNCLVAIELKVERFEPEHLGKLNFYLEALDRDVRKPHENPAIGVLLCASKDSEVVEYALSRTLSPALVAQYQTQLPDKQLLADKLHEFYALNAPTPETEPVPAPRALTRNDPHAQARLTYDVLRDEALSLPGVQESTSYGTPALKVRNKLMARLKEDLETVVLRSTWEDRERLMAVCPEVFQVTEHYRAHPWVLVRLPAADLDLVRPALHAAWRLTAPTSLVRQHPRSGDPLD